MSSDTRIVFRILLAFAVYGLANYLGNIGKFLPPIILDYLALPFIGLWFLLITVRKAPKAILPVMLYSGYLTLMALMDPGCRAFLRSALGISFFQPLTQETLNLMTLPAFGLLLASVIAYWGQVFVSRKMLKADHMIYHLAFSASLLSLVILLWANTFWIYPMLVTCGISLITVVRKDDELDSVPGIKRYILLVFLTLSLDLMQYAALKAI